MIELCAIIVSDVWKKKKKQSDSHAISVLNERIEILAYFFTSVMFFFNYFIYAQSKFTKFVFVQRFT